MTQLSSHNIGQQLKAFTIRKSLIFTIAIASLGIVIATVFSWLGQNPVAIAGALDIKDTDYPVPAGAIFVATTGTNDGSCGQEVSPCQTIQYAISNRATSGDTIVIRGGTYHESVAFNMPPAPASTSMP